MQLLRKILFPFSLLYALIVTIRNFLFNIHFFKSTSYHFPVICVGNLSVGGTGKTPMIEYLINTLTPTKKVATLSRGYKRKSKGFLMGDEKTTVLDLGDEPYQYFKKYKDITVAVDADRKNGISQLRKPPSSSEVILLDDAFQHRKVKTGLNILLTVYNDLYIDDYLLPTGNLRDNRREAKRADIIIITKCPSNLTIDEKNKITQRLKIRNYQKVFFSAIRYNSNFYSKEKIFSIDDLKNKKCTLVTGIANPSHLLNYLQTQELDFEHINYGDHHHFSEKEIAMLQNKEMIITTEKDYMRLHALEKACYLPIEMHILFNEESHLNKEILTYVNNKSEV